MTSGGVDTVGDQHQNSSISRNNYFQTLPGSPPSSASGAHRTKSRPGVTSRTIGDRYSRNQATTLTPSALGQSSKARSTQRASKRRPPSTVIAPMDPNRMMQMKSWDLNAKTLVGLGSIWQSIIDVN